jgi:hypothetical protein
MRVCIEKPGGYFDLLTFAIQQVLLHSVKVLAHCAVNAWRIIQFRAPKYVIKLVHVLQGTLEAGGCQF